MAIKVLIKRKFKPGSLKKATQLLNRARYGAMGMKGYISSETLTDTRDPDNIVVVSMWHDLKAWDAWRESSSRAEFTGEMQKIMEGPESIESYNLGLQTDIS